nr:reverse transcriptase domain-containing protein [Tanacetum cinerariifolium]
MAPVTRQGQNPPPPNTNTPPHHMTPESVQTMIDQALLRNSTNGDGSQSSHEDNPRHVDLMDRENGIRFQHQWLCYRESGELKKLEIELWNLKVKGNDVSTYTNRFQELTLICTKFVYNESEKIDKYISGLPDSIYGNVKSYIPRTLDETIELTNDLMDQKLRTYAERADNKRKTDDTSSGNANVANAQRDGKETPKGNGCFECEALGHFKRDCPKLKNKNKEKGMLKDGCMWLGMRKRTRMHQSLYHYPLCRLAILCHDPHAHDLESFLTISPSTYALSFDRFTKNVSFEEEVVHQRLRKTLTHVLELSSCVYLDVRAWGVLNFNSAGVRL